jgi:glucose 1-dehydrogenase
MMMRNLSIELAPYGITINNIAPGAIETPIYTKLLHDPEKLIALLETSRWRGSARPQTSLE